MKTNTFLNVIGRSKTTRKRPFGQNLNGYKYENQL